VGPQGLSTEGDANFESLAIDSSGKPYLAYQSTGLTVRKWNGTDWDPLGGTNLFSPVSDPVLSLDSQNTPYVIFSDGQTGIARVKKWDGASWLAVGPDVTPGMAMYLSIAVYANDTPSAAFFDVSGDVRCQELPWQALRLSARHGAIWRRCSGARAWPQQMLSWCTR
jgi:hypothetical protein